MSEVTINIKVVNSCAMHKIHSSLLILRDSLLKFSKIAWDKCYLFLPKMHYEY